MSKKKNYAISSIELLYLCDDDFIEAVNKLRSKFFIKTGKNGLVAIKELLEFDNKIINDMDLSKEFDSEVLKLCKKFNLEDSFYQTQSFIESGSSYTDTTTLESIKSKSQYFGKISRPLIKPVKDSKGLPVPEPRLKVCFYIRKPITSKQLEKWFEDYNGQILIEANDHFKGKKSPIFINSRLPRILKIIEMRRKKMTFSKIADQLCDEYENDPDVIQGKVNESSVRKIYSRYTNRKK